MTTTGFVTPRAEEHDKCLERLFKCLDARGYEPERLGKKHGDIAIWDHVRKERAVIDLKTRFTRHNNFTVDIEAFRHYRKTALDCPVYILLRDQHGLSTVDTPDTLAARILNGPRRATEDGSDTNWFLVRPQDPEHATMFDDYFPPNE